MSAATALAAPSSSVPCALGSLRCALQAVANLSGGQSRERCSRTWAGRASARLLQVTAPDGERFAVHAVGSGRPIVLVHGLGGSHRVWDALVRRLAPHHRLYTWDARGHGARAADAAPTLASLADDLASVVAQLQGQRPLLVGHSMGALTVMAYLARHGEADVSGVCLIDQSPRVITDDGWDCGLFGGFSRAQHQALMQRLRQDFTGAVLDEAERHLPPALRALARRFDCVAALLRRVAAGIRSQALVSLLESIGGCDFRATLDALRLPALVVLGGRSGHYGGVPLADYYTRTLRCGTVTTYPGAPHSVHVQAPAMLARDLSAFASAIWPLRA